MDKMITVTLLLCLVLFTCKDGGTDPTHTGQDTTSHNFKWSIEVLGDGAGSILHDVSIINDTVAYAVGEIYLRDSTGQIDPIAYSVAIWNGSKWTLKRLYYSNNNLILSIRGVHVFGTNDVWLAAGSVFRWDGVSSQAELSFSRLTLPARNATVEKFWGTTSSNLFGVGNAGTIVHYNGTWSRIESATTLDIRDIWGATDPQTGQQTILAIASGSSPDEGKKLLRIDGTTVTALTDSGLSWSLNGLWFVPNQEYFVVGAGIHQKNSLNDAVWASYPSGVVTSYESGGVRGNGINDVFVVGSFFEVVHFNGSSWYNYRNEIPVAPGALGGIAVKGNLVIAVGLLGQQAVAVIGRR